MTRRPLDVVISVDVECDIHGALTFPDRRTPLGEEAVFRRQGNADHGLGFITRTLSQHGLPGVFFIETLCSRFFGDGCMQQAALHIVESGTHDLQLHLHPEWRYFGSAGWREELAEKRKGGWRPRPKTSELPAEEIVALTREAIGHFERATGRRPQALRTGSLSTERSLYPALVACGLTVSSSVGMAIAPPADEALHLYHDHATVDGVLELPITSFTDLRLGPRRRLRCLTVIGCTDGELIRVLERAHRQGVQTVVLLTHPSEFSWETEAPGAAVGFQSNVIAQRRFQALCAHLAQKPQRFKVTTVEAVARDRLAQRTAPSAQTPVHIGPWGNLRRLADARQMAH